MHLCMSMCSAEEGEIIVSGQTQFGVKQIHMYNMDVLKGHRSHRIYPRPQKCNHDTVYLLEADITDQKYLMISCGLCQKITAINKGSKKIERTVVWKSTTKQQYRPGRMCLGGKGKIIVVDCSSQCLIIFDITSTKFHPKRNIHMGVDVDNLCYADVSEIGGVVFATCRDPLTTGSGSTCQVLAKAIDTEEVIWTLDEVAYSEMVQSDNSEGWYPEGICSDYQGHLFIGDSGNKQIVMVEISTGHILKLFQPVEIAKSGWIHMSWSKSQNRLILSHGDSDSKITIYAVI